MTNTNPLPCNALLVLYPGISHRKVLVIQKQLANKPVYLWFCGTQSLAQESQSSIHTLQVFQTNSFTVKTEVILNYKS